MCLCKPRVKFHTQFARAPRKWLLFSVSRCRNGNIMPEWSLFFFFLARGNRGTNRTLIQIRGARFIVQAPRWVRGTLETGLFLCVPQLCTDQEDLLQLATFQSPETKRRNGESRGDVWAQSLAGANDCKSITVIPVFYYAHSQDN